ncbi:MAG: HipA domain-containing protein [Parabacteroides distasonis]|uniref:HipA domain-containing protein n=1 Tax=Parabacteroides distasonis TaxID=823 RepID=UPI00209E8729|nr:HipA domain-containing protein [Parabacteroides distasonis]MCI6391941.1 HipA domain-containing protein [Parabacteroides distasonis]MCS2603979.1 HipA domain-containing protein [Parabacteroides distasonis]UVR02786.1 HipA domain-containing protein [Parabacteroides distasonis]UVS10682.1 HipA domain-containing protein [Parabacteroides distasonis]
MQKSDTDTCQWHLAPTYDLTLCTEGYNGKHATSVNGTGHPTIQDMITIGTKSKMSKPHCMRIFEEVRAGCGDLLRNIFFLRNLLVVLKYSLKETNPPLW